MAVSVAAKAAHVMVPEVLVVRHIVSLLLVTKAGRPLVVHVRHEVQRRILVMLRLLLLVSMMRSVSHAVEAKVIWTVVGGSDSATHAMAMRIRQT